MKLKTVWKPEDIRSRLGKSGGVGFLFHATDAETLSFAYEEANDADLWEEQPFLGSPIFFENRVIGAHIITPLPAYLWAGSHSGIRRFRTVGFEPSLRLAAETGLTHLGLGAMVPFATDYGRQGNRSEGVKLTTGHAATVAAIRMTLLSAAKEIGFNPLSLTYAIFGGAGSIGANTARWFVRTGMNRLVLVDLPARINRLEVLAQELRSIDPTSTVLCCSKDSLPDLPGFDCGIVATSASEPWIDENLLSRAPVWIDDSHPRAAFVKAEQELFNSVLYLECFLRGPRTLCQTFPFRLPTSRDCYSCFAEAFVCWRLRMETDFVCGPASLDQIALMDAQLPLYGFSAGPLTSKNGEPVSSSAIVQCRQALSAKLPQDQFS